MTEHIKRVLNNKTLCSQMYFGPGIEVENKSEFWHGNGHAYRTSRKQSTVAGGRWHIQ